MSQDNDATPLVEGLNFPTSLAFDPEGVAYIAESGLAFGGASPGGRILRITPDGNTQCIKDGLRAPVNGLTYYQGELYISEGGNPGRISCLAADGQWRVILDHLPGGGNYHTNEVTFGPDGWLYFGQGAMTNSGIIGPDALNIAWLRTLPHPPDIPGINLQLTGMNAACELQEGQTNTTGAFAPFGTPTHEGQQLAGKLPCTSAVMRCRPDGNRLELVAWGLRNPYGLGFSNGGRLLALDLGINDRGSRPVGNVPDCLFEVEPGWWYGWPDYAAGIPVTDQDYLPKRGPAPKPLIADHASLPPVRQPLIAFEIHAAPVKFTICQNGAHQGWLYIALFGDKMPMTGPPGPKAGRYVVRANPKDWSYEPVATPPLERPIDLEFHPKTGDLYVLDFGNYEMSGKSNLKATAGSGKLYRINQ